MFIDEKEFCCALLDGMTMLILENDEWDAYHAFRRTMNKRFNRDGYRIYLDKDYKHKIEKIEP